MSISWREVEGFLLRIEESDQFEGPHVGDLIRLVPGARVTAFAKDPDSTGCIVTGWERVARCLFERPRNAPEKWLDAHLEALVDAVRPREWGEAPPYRTPGLYSLDQTLVSLRHPTPSDCFVEVFTVDMTTGATRGSLVAEATQLASAGEAEIRPLSPWYAADADLHRLDRYRGCLLGGALGEAYGVKMAQWRKSKSKGEAPRFSSLSSSSRQLTISFNTHLAMFTSEGLVRAQVRWRHKGICNPAAVLWRAYQRWLFLQGRLGTKPPWDEWRDHGWLALVEGLHPIRYCPKGLLDALQRPFGDAEETPEWNQARHATALTRLAPLGLFDAKEPWLSRFVTLTDGHPLAVDAVRFLNRTVSALVEGESLEAASRVAAAVVTESACRASLKRAVSLARSAANPEEAIPLLEGAGYAENILAVALFCGLRSSGFTRAVEMAALHARDAVTAACLTGTLVGAWLGKRAFKEHLGHLQLAAVIELLATDVFYDIVNPDSEWLADDWWKYPGC